MFGGVRHLIDVERVLRVRWEVVVGVIAGRINFGVGDGPSREFPRATNARRKFPVTDRGQVAFVVKRQPRRRGVEKGARTGPVGVHCCQIFFFNLKINVFLLRLQINPKKSACLICTVLKQKSLGKTNLFLNFLLSFLSLFLKIFL